METEWSYSPLYEPRIKKDYKILLPGLALKIFAKKPKKPLMDSSKWVEKSPEIDDCTRYCGKVMDLETNSLFSTGTTDRVIAKTSAKKVFLTVNNVENLEFRKKLLNNIEKIETSKVSAARKQSLNVLPIRKPNNIFKTTSFGSKKNFKEAKNLQKKNFLLKSMKKVQEKTYKKTVIQSPLPELSKNIEVNVPRIPGDNTNENFALEKSQSDGISSNSFISEFSHLDDMKTRYYESLKSNFDARCNPLPYNSEEESQEVSNLQNKPKVAPVKLAIFGRRSILFNKHQEKNTIVKDMPDNPGVFKSRQSQIDLRLQSKTIYNSLASNSFQIQNKIEPHRNSVENNMYSKIRRMSSNKALLKPLLA